VLFFTIVAVAIMIAVQECLATIFGFLLARFLCTAILMSILSESCPTESAFLRLLIFFELCTSFTNVIWLLLALRTEILLALRAPDSIHTHMFLSSFAYIFAIIIFIGTDLALNDLN
jgi:hypothetical protein